MNRKHKFTGRAIGLLLIGLGSVFILISMVLFVNSKNNTLDNRHAVIVNANQTYGFKPKRHLKKQSNKGRYDK